MDLFASQAHVRRRLSLRCWASALLSVAAVLAAVVVAWTFLRLPIILWSSHGASVATVERRLGPPVRRWHPEEFECFPSYGCDRSKARGEVLFFIYYGIGYYAFFTESGVLYNVDVSTS